MFLPKMSKDLHKSFEAVTHLAEGLCLNDLLTRKSRKYSNLLRRHTDTNSVIGRVTIDFALENISKKHSIEMSSSRCCVSKFKLLRIKA